MSRQRSTLAGLWEKPLVTCFESNACALVLMLQRMLSVAIRWSAVVLALWPPSYTLAANVAETVAIAMHGNPGLPADFDHMAYANPDAPKGGRLVFGLLGTFDSLN